MLSDKEQAAVEKAARKANLPPRTWARVMLLAAALAGCGREPLAVDNATPDTETATDAMAIRIDIAHAATPATPADLGAPDMTCWNDNSSPFCYHRDAWIGAQPMPCIEATGPCAFPPGTDNCPPGWCRGR